MGNIIDRPRYRGPKIAAKQAIPRTGHVRLRCGNCGGMQFEPHVRVLGAVARVVELVCLSCLRFYHITPTGFIEGSGKKTINPKDDYTRPPPTLEAHNGKN